MSANRLQTVLTGFAAVLLAGATAHAGGPVPTGFTYQGQLKQSGAVVTDTCDFEFRLFDDPTLGTQIGGTLTLDGLGGNPPPIKIVDGLFTVALDFGAGVFDGNERYLEIGVRCPSGIGAYTTLSPRQPITAAPYALFALNGGGGGGLTLPFAATITDPADAFSVTNLGGRAFAGITALDGAPAIYGEHTGEGRAGLFQNLNAGSFANVLEAFTNSIGTAFVAANTGFGRAARFEILNADSPAEAVRVLTNSGLNFAISAVNSGTQSAAGPVGAGSFINTGSASPALIARTNAGAAAHFMSGGFDPFLFPQSATLRAAQVRDAAGAGSAASFFTSGVLNDDPTVYAETLGPGTAGLFTTSSGAVALTATNNGTGGGFLAFAGSGEAGIFRSSGALFPTLDVRNTGGGPAATIAVPPIGTADVDALLVVHQGVSGSAGEFQVRGPANTGAAVLAENSGSGPGGVFRNYDAAAGPSDNTEPALRAFSNSNQPAGVAVFELENGSSDAAALSVITKSEANGIAAEFTSQAITNTGATLEAIHHGRGRAGSFRIENVNPDPGAANEAPAVEGFTLGMGQGGYFEINRPFTGSATDPENTGAAAVHGKTNGAGPAALFERLSPTPGVTQSPTLKVTGNTRDTVAEIDSVDMNNQATALVVRQFGPGLAARFDALGSGGRIAEFVANAPTEFTDAVAVDVNNRMHALYVKQSGTGEAAHFENVPGNNFNAVFINNNHAKGTSLFVNNSLGKALQVTGRTQLAGFVEVFNGLTVQSGQLCAGNVCAAIKLFHIDHPLDPQNKYLYHSCVESDEMKNVYDGVAVTDNRGYATIELPQWFEALNRDFRYQLTVIDEADGDAFVLAKVVQGVKDNRFRIRTSRPSVSVSWQVTGVRQDAYARANPLQVEVDKPADKRGLYLHPEAFGQPARMGMHYEASQAAEKRRCTHAALPDKTPRPSALPSWSEGVQP